MDFIKQYAKIIGLAGIIAISAIFLCFKLMPGTGLDVNVYVAPGVSEPKDYSVLASILQNASRNDTIYLHLYGPGGRVGTVIYLNNLIQNCKANVVTVIDGNVYSADALLGMLGKKIHLDVNVDFMFHHPVIEDANGHQMTESEACLPYLTILDRGQSAYDKCMMYMKEGDDQYKLLFDKMIKPYLTADELKRYNQGFDVIIKGSDMAKRLGDRQV